MSSGDYVTYGGIKYRQSDIKNFEKIKIREYHNREDIYIVTLNNGVKIASNDTSAPANAASGASVFLNDDKSVSLHNVLFTDIKGVEGQQDVFKVTGKETMRNAFYLDATVMDNDKIIVGEDIPCRWFEKLNRFKLKEGDNIVYNRNLLVQNDR